ncbi:MAG: hypothetical protein AB7E79_00605 [Rhodospirillaceae bacterium]
MGLIQRAGAALILVGLSGCSNPEWREILRNTVAGTAEGACRARAACSTGTRSDPLAPRPAWHTGGALPNDAPTPVVRE